MYFNSAIELGCNHAGGIQSFVLAVTEPSLGFNVPECLSQFVFKLVDEILWNGPACVDI